MKLPGSYRKSERGVTYIELLVASLLMAIGLMGLVNTWFYSYQMTTNTDDSGIAYNLGRFSLERVKMNGFKNAAEGTSNLYYSGNEVAVAAGSATCRYTATTSVTSSSVKSGTIGVAGAVPADAALRTVVITVKMYSTNAVIYQTTTYLSRAGI